MNKKAQHEIVGFILIVVIVVIIGLFMLVFYLRQPAIKSKNQQVASFLRASMYYTTDCIISQPEYDNIEDLIKSCYNNKMCVNLEDKMACEVLENTLKEIVHESWLVTSEKPVNAYFVNISYLEGDIEEEILSLQEGNCTGSRTGDEHFFSHAPGNIFITMDICYT